MQVNSITSHQMLRLPAVISLVGLSRSSVYFGVKNGSFPAPVKLSSRAVGWPSYLVQDWISDRIKESGKA
jgi:prophage regulatory protein